MSGAKDRFQWLRNARFIEGYVTSDGEDEWRFTGSGEWALMTLAEAFLTNAARQEAACGPFTIRRAYSVPSDEAEKDGAAHSPDGYCACAYSGPDHNPAWTGDDVVYPCDNCSCLDFRLPPDAARDRAEQVAEMERTGWPERAITGDGSGDVLPPFDEKEKQS